MPHFAYLVIWLLSGFLGFIFIMLAETFGIFPLGENILPKEKIPSSFILSIAHLAFGPLTLVLGIYALQELKSYLKWQQEIESQ